MNRRNLLNLHKKVGVVFAPFFILSGITAIPLFFRKDDLYSKETKKLLLGLHNWEIGMKYIGIVLALALIFMSVSGLVLYFRRR